MTRPLQVPSAIPCAWILGGVHGNEPAGVAAICEHGAFPEPCLVIPCAHSLGLVWGTRFGDDMDSYRAVYDGLVSLADRYPPRFLLNLHEDDEAFEYRGAYCYHYGRRTELVHVALDAVREAGLRVAEREDTTWEHEKIVGGVIQDPNETAIDPSIDHYLNARFGTEVIVFETPSSVWPRKARLRAHRAVLSRLPILWEIATG